MSGFTRPAPWLRRLFTPSKTEFREPSSVSDDVSLVQPYDGGGYPVDPGVEKVFTVQSATGADTYTDLYTCAIDEISRLCAFSILLDAGGVPGVNLVVDAGAAPEVLITDNITPNTTRHVPGGLIHLPVIGPGCRVRMHVWGGDVNSQCTCNWMEYRVPVGSVFYL